MIYQDLLAFLDANYRAIFRYTEWRVESHCLAPGTDDDGHLLPAQSLPVDRENAAANVLARAWRRIERTKEDKLLDSLLAFLAYGHGEDWALRAIWRQAIKAEARTWRWEFGGTGSRQVSHSELGEYDPAYSDDDEPTDITGVLDAIETLPAELFAFAMERYMPILFGEEQPTMSEVAEIMGCSRRTCFTLNRDFRAIMEIALS